MSLNITLLYIFFAVLNLVLGALVFLQNHKKRVNQTFALFTLNQVLWIASLYFGYYFLQAEFEPQLSIIFIKLAYGFGLLMFPFLSLFFYYFPRKTFKLNKLVKYFLLPGSILISVIAASSSLVHKAQVIQDGIYIADEFGPLYSIYTFFLFSQLGTCFYFAFKKLKGAAGIAKKKITVTAIGGWLFLLLISLGNVILPIFGIYVFPYKTVSYSVFFLLPAFYAIQRLRFFTLSYLSFNLLRKLILLSVFIGLSLVNYHLLISFFPSLDQEILFLISAVLAGIIFKKIENFIPELITQDLKQFRNTILRLKATIAHCEDFNQLKKTLENTFIIKLHLSKIELFVVRDEEIKLNLPVYLRDEFIEKLTKYKTDILIVDEINYSNFKKNDKEILKNAMHKLNAEICMPIFSDKTIAGLLIIGQKENKEHYNSEEVEEILKIKPQLEISLVNILFNQNLQEENILMKSVIEQKTKELKEQFKKIKELLSKQTEFLNVTAHEFRTPLSIALFKVEELIENNKKDKNFVIDVKEVEDSLKSLKDLTQKFFDAQQLDLDKLKLNKEEVNIDEFLKGIHKDFGPIAKEAGIKKFSFVNNLKTSVKLSLDKSQIKRVILNLLDNAKKFADEIALQVEEGPKKVVIKVIDNGIGVDDSAKDKIFEKFEVRKVSQSTGIGLGLFLCKSILSLHKGDIWVEDSKNGGATFAISLDK